MILVTGATGLIGSHICRQLVQSGQPFKAFIRNKNNIPDTMPDGIEWIEGDILDFESIYTALDGISVVIHTAALVSFYSKEFKLMDKINVRGTANMVNGALKCGVRRFIHLSSIAALGRPPNNAIISEDAKWVSSPENSYYGETKYHSELEVWRGYEEGLSTVIVNPSVVLGTGNWEKSSTKMFKYAWDEHKYYPSGSFNYVDLRDVVDVIMTLIDSDIKGKRFILNGGKISYLDFFTKVAVEFGKKPPYIHASNMLSKLVVFAEKVRSLLTGKEPMVTGETLLMSKRNFEYDNSKIKNAIEFEFRNLDSTITWACAGLKN